MRAARTDTNQREIVEALRAAGAKVQPLHAVGHGFPDALVYYGGRIHLLEIKTTTGKLTKDEARWHEAWGCATVVRSIADALAAVGATEGE